MTINPETVRTIVGVVGNVISFSLFCSPIPTFVKIIKQKSVQEFRSDPYLATLLNCMIWSFYGMPFVHPDSLLVLTINGIGLVMELVYVAIFFTYSNRAQRKRIMISLAIEVIFMTILIACTMIFLHTTKDRSMLIGILCIVFNIIMYASPLTVMKIVIKTKSVKYLPFSIALTNLLNGCNWSIYALIKFDPYILIPNGLGVFSGVVQLSLYAIYYKSTNWDEDEESQKATKMTNVDDTRGRRRKYELRILAGAEVQSEDVAGDEDVNLASHEDPDMDEGNDKGGSKDEFINK